MYINKIIFSTLFILLFLNPTNAQISDQDARAQFYKAEELFEAGNFYKCNQVLEDLIRKMGKPNPKVLYLCLKSVYNNLERKDDKSDYVYKKNYRNFMRLNYFADQFFQLADKNTYPADKYSEIAVIRDYIQQGIKKYEYQKDRKPEDAIRFLNDCAKKFQKGLRDPGEKLKYGLDMFWTVEYRLQDSCLIIDVFSTTESSKRVENSFCRELYKINLSKVWIVRKPIRFAGGGLSNTYSNIEDKSMHELDMDAPLIISSLKKWGDSKVFNDISHYDYRKEGRIKYDNADFEKWFQKLGFFYAYIDKYFCGIYPYSYFIQNQEYKEGNYRDRILEAFEFLIDYYGGGSPVEDQVEINSSKF